MPIIWESKLDTGIDVIDHQHRRIVDYINDLEIAKAMGDKKKVTDVIEQLIDYTQSHFGFEESMMEEAGYKFLKPHKKVHELFIKRVTDFTMRAAKGEDIADELHSMLAKWLINHIASEDRDYSDTVKSMVGAEAAHHEVATQKPEARPGFIPGLLGGEYDERDLVAGHRTFDHRIAAVVPVDLAADAIAGLRELHRDVDLVAVGPDHVAEPDAVEVRG